MSKGVQATVEVIGALVAVYFGDNQLAAALLSAAYQTERSARAEITARNAYNRSLHDRYVQIRSTQAARTLVYGRARVSGPTFFVSSWGADRQQLTYLVALAAHEVDAIETVYFDDKPVFLDGSGNVVGLKQTDSFSIAAATATVQITSKAVSGSVGATARYGEDLVTLTVSVSGQNVTVSGARTGQTGQLDVFYQPDPDPYGPVTRSQISEQFTIATGHDTFTLSRTPDLTGVKVVYKATSGTADDSASISYTLTGAAVTISGGTVGRTAVVYYQVSSGITKARVRKYTGSSSQLADATLQSEFPGIWTPAHRAQGVAYLIVELTYDQDAFLSGAPNVSAVVRGRKCFDPRTNLTAWTENPALHARDLATHSLGGNLPSAAIDDAGVIAAANICDVSTSYVVGGVTHVRPLYTSAYVYSCDHKPMDGLTDLCQAMGGTWIWSEGQWRPLAGTYRTPNPGVLDETWLTDDQPVTVQCGYARLNKVNTITSSIADQFQDYRVVPLTKLSPDDYVAEDNGVLSQDIQYAAVPFSGQAQYISSCLLRRQRQGLVVSLGCNYRAWQAETGDVLLVSLNRFGWSQKPFEVLEDTWQADGSFLLTLQETDSSIWDIDAGFPATDPAPNTNFPAPWGLLPPTNLVVTSNDSTLLRQADGTVVPRISVSWDPITDSRVLQGGYVEVRYWRLGDPTDSYLSVRTAGTNSQVYLPDARVGSQYLVAARTVSVVTQSGWSDQTGATVFGKTTPPGNVGHPAATVVNNVQHLTWDASTDYDYKLTEIRSGASWAAGTVIASIAGKSFDWLSAPTGGFTLWFAHMNRSGIYSATPASITGTVFPPLPTLFADAATTPHTAPANAGVKFNTTGYIAYRQGGTSSSYVDQTAFIWGDAAPPANSYQIRFDLYAPVTTTVGPGTPTLSGSIGTLTTLSASLAQSVQLSITNGSAYCTIAWTLYDSTGTNQLASGLIKLSVESED